MNSFTAQTIISASKCQGQHQGDGAQQPYLLSRHHTNGIVPLQMTASASSAAESNVTSSTSSTAVAEPTIREDEDDQEDEEQLEMPWSNVQEWALQDNLAKFTVIIPPPVTGGKARRYAMWRTLMREVPELAGYPVPFLLKMHQRSLKKKSTDSNTREEGTPGVLPMVDDFEFISNGGISGRAYGLPGIADGTSIQSPSLISAETTVPLGYVTTKGDANSENEVGFSYELGNCASSSEYSLNGTERSAALAAARRLVLEGAVDTTRGAASVAKDMAVTGSGLLSDTETNRDLAYLGGATAMLLASATAVGMLSHHLTVNVFWV